MSGEFVPVSVEYIITTTSDWTTFQIIEGGWWSNFQPISILKGFDRLTREIVYNEKTIIISKKQFDKSVVEVHVRGTLNILTEYIESYVTYLITKGDIESTVVRMIVEGKEISPSLVNGTNVPNEPTNALSFQVPAEHYLKPLQVKRVIDVLKEKPKEKVKPKKEEVITIKIREVKHIIIETFDKLFQEILKMKEPSEKNVKDVFKWLQSHSENATKFLEADIYRDLTLKAETHFWRFTNLEKTVNSESRKTLKKIRNRYDELRKIQGKFAVQTPYLGGIEKEEQRVAPKE